MRVIVFSWEYPPRIVGDLADYVRDLAVQLVKNNQQTWVVTYHEFLTGESDDAEGVKTIRVKNPVRTHIGVLTWVLTLNQEVERAAAGIYYSADKHVDVIDAEDWHFIPAAVTLKKGLNIPFVYSVDSLEEHRSHGANAPFNMSIKSIESLGLSESERVLVKSDWMQSELVRLYKTPKDKIRVISPKSNNWIKEILETYQTVSGGRQAT
jgi:glycogen(starch) synthase